MNEHRFDVIIIGAGIGGLVAAAALAKEGLRVAVYEARHHPGGYCTSFKRPGPFTFNVAISSFSALNPCGWLGSILDQLGIYQPSSYIKLETLKDVIFPRHRLRIMAGVQNFQEQLIGLFPLEQEGIKKIFHILREIYQELQGLTAAQLAGNFRGVSFPSYSRYKNYTFRRLLDSLLKDSELKALLGGQCFYMGSPPSRASLVAVASMLMAYLEDGTYHSLGGAQALPDLLARYIQEQGGKIFLRKPVEALLLEDDRVTGVKLPGGEPVLAPRVISNVDLTRTLEMLPEVPVLEDYRRRIGTLALSPPYFKVYLGVDLPLHTMDLPPHLDYFSTYHIEEIFAQGIKGCYSPENFSYEISIPSLVDNTMAPPGQHTVTVTLLAGYGARDWKKDKAEIRDFLIERIEGQIPGISGHLSWVDAATPWTMERFTGNREGAAYGWEQIPEQMGGRRISPVTPVKGLYLAGHWTTPGGGIASAAVSGILAAKELLRRQ